MEAGVQRFDSRDVMPARRGDDVRRHKLWPLGLGLTDACARNRTVSKQLFDLAGDEVGPIAIHVHNRGQLDEARTHPRQLDEAPQVPPSHAAASDQRKLVCHASPSRHL